MSSPETKHCTTDQEKSKNQYTEQAFLLSLLILLSSFSMQWPRDSWGGPGTVILEQKSTHFLKIAIKRDVTLRGINVKSLILFIYGRLALGVCKTWKRNLDSRADVRTQGYRIPFPSVNQAELQDYLRVKEKLEASFFVKYLCVCE